VGEGVEKFKAQRFRFKVRKEVPRRSSGDSISNFTAVLFPAPTGNQKTELL
jgi:hypothetical protein